MPLRAPQAILSLISHKGLRWLSPAFVIGTFVTSIVLSGASYGYAAAAVAQGLLLLCGLAGCLPVARRVSVLALAHYFCLVQAAAGVGFVRGLAGAQSVLWRRFDRVPSPGIGVHIMSGVTLAGSSALRSVRAAVAPAAKRALFWAGGYAVTRAMLPSRRLAILRYHAVCEPDAGYADPGICVSPSAFERHVAYLASHYSVLPLPEAVAILKRGATLPRNAVAITFDDGYRGQSRRGPNARAPRLDRDFLHHRRLPRGRPAVLAGRSPGADSGRESTCAATGRWHGPRRHTPWQRDRTQDGNQDSVETAEGASDSSPRITARAAPSRGRPGWHAELHVDVGAARRDGSPRDDDRIPYDDAPQPAERRVRPTHGLRYATPRRSWSGNSARR